MTFAQQMENDVALVEDYLSHVFLSREPRADLYDAMQYSLLAGGKRLRPVLMLETGRMCGGDPAAILPFACAIEMVHTYSLIHDDLPCMDDDDLRRGRPTNHKVYGEDMALLAGDGLLTLAFETALSFNGRPEDTVKALRLLAEYAGARGMVGGQCIDLSVDGTQVDLDTLQEMDQGKTVALIAAACTMGCVAAGAGEEELAAAKHFAQGLGMAFQLRDDVLDVLGDAQKLGKNTGMDSAHEKRNYVTLLGVEEAQRLVGEYTKEALEALKEFPGDAGFLREYAIALVERDT